MCGKEFETRRKHQKYCSYECSTQANLQQQKEYQLTHKRAPKPEPKPAVKPKKIKKPLSEWIAEAAACGLSYGRYRAAVEQLGLSLEELKERGND